MAWSLIANTGAGSTNNTSVTTPAIDTTGANLLVLCLHRYQGASENTISDSKGNTWTGLTLSTRSDAKCRIFYCANPTVGSSHTFSASSVSNTSPAITVSAWSGAHASAPYASIENQGNAAAASSTLQPGSVTASAAPALLITTITSATYGPTNPTISGWTKTNLVSFNAGTNMAGCMAYLVQDPASAINPTWANLDTSLGKAASIAAFVPAAAGGGPIVHGGGLTHGGALTKGRLAA